MRLSQDYPILRLPRLKAGVGHKTLTLIWLGSAAIFAALGPPYGFGGFPISALLHWTLAWFFKKDHQILQVYDRYERMTDVYAAGLMTNGKTNMATPGQQRPQGYAKDIPL